MSTSRLNGALSPPLARSGAPSPRPKVSEAVSTYTQTLVGSTWDAKDKARMSQLSKSISEKVKAKMVELQPRGFKYIVTATLTENLGQAGRADMTCHWEDSDIAIQEMWSNLLAYEWRRYLIIKEGFKGHTLSLSDRPETERGV